MTQDDTERRRYVYIGERNLIDILSGKMIISNFPKDAKILRAGPADSCYGGGVALIIQSQEFDVVELGQRCPSFNALFRSVK